MPSTRKQQRDRERQRAAQAARQAEADAAVRRRRLVAGLVVGLALAATVVAVVAATGEDEGDVTAAASSTTSTSDPLATPEGPPEPTPVDVPLPAPGATLTGEVACPPATGAPERVTSFEAPPPMCLATGPDGAVDPGVEYTATVRTSAGDLVYLLDAQRAPRATNDFVVLARYGYFDGAPLDTVVRTGWAEFGGAFDDGGAPGSTVAWDMPTEAPEVGTIQVPGSLSLAPVPGSDGLEAQGGRFLIAVGDQAADLPARTTVFGLLLDGTEAFPAIARAGTESGRPGAVITIEGVDVTEAPAEG